MFTAPVFSDGPTSWKAIVKGLSRPPAFGDQQIVKTRESAKGHRRKSPLLRQGLALLAAPLLAACGLNGTDPDEAEQQAASEAAPVPADPELAAFETADIPDPISRPEMQLQVVLDQQGFGPGVIDGGMGMSTQNALKGFQEAHSLAVTGRLDAATRQALEQWRDVPATRVVRIPESWGQLEFADVPDEPEDQAEMEHLGYESLDEKLAERFHTTVEVLRELNPDGQPAGTTTESATSAAGAPKLAAGGQATAQGNAAAARRASASPSPSGSETPQQVAFRPGQLVRVPNIGLDDGAPTVGGDDKEWQRTLASLGVNTDQPKVSRVVVDKSESWLKGYDDSGKLVAMYTVTSGSGYDPLPLGEWKILGVSKNPPFNYNPDLFWDAEPSDEKAKLPPGPNGPVGVVWIDLSKEHYGIHGTPEPQTIGRAQSHGCVRLTNWDAARLAGMVGATTKVVFQA
jgi:lipoprotein-anchoring transpeptidase ErfK/SrfK